MKTTIVTCLTFRRCPLLLALLSSLQFTTTEAIADGVRQESK